MEDKKSNNLQVQKSSEIHEGTKNKKNKKKYYKNSSYYYYKNLKKKKNKQALEATTTIDIIKDNDNVIEQKTEKIDNKKDTNFINDNKNKKYNKNDKNKNIKKDINDKDLIITKEFSFAYGNPDDLKEKEKIEDLKLAIDSYYFEEELGKFSIKEEKSHLKSLPPLTEEEKKKLGEPVKKKKIKETLSDIQPIINFASNPITKSKTKKIDSEDIIDTSTIANNIDNEDLIITRQINFDYDAKDLKKKKVLNELKEAIEDFDRLEMIHEINESSDNLNVVEEQEEASSNNSKEEIIEKESLEAEKIIKKIETKDKEIEDNDLELNNNIDKVEEKKKESIFKSLFKKKKEKKEEKVLESVEDLNDYILKESLAAKDKEEKVEKVEKSDEDKKYLDTKVQPIIEEDKFTQILNKIELEEKLQKIADSDESSNYLAEDFLYFKRNKGTKVHYDHNNKRKLYWTLGVVVLIVIVLIILIDYVHRDGSIDFVSPSYSSPNETGNDKEKLFNECLFSNYQINDKDEEIVALEQEITEYIKNKYNASFMYQDVATGYSFGYNSSEIYYAASTIKLLDALYIYTKASQGAIDLDATITYSSKYDVDVNSSLRKYNYGDNITIRELVKYAVTVSDNSAHTMLVSYIGKSKLRDFGNEVGASNTLVTYSNYASDYFGSINAIDAIAYLRATNEFINSNEQYGKELKELLIGSDQPYLNLNDTIVSAHKYGDFAENYHNIGIVYDKYPYMIAILSREGHKNNEESMIRDINEHIYKLHKLYYEKRDTKCYVDIYMN